jgi:hypothetical protein
MIASVVIVGAVTYIASTVTVHYTVTATSTTEAPFNYTQPTNMSVAEGATIYIPMDVKNVDTYAHTLSCAVSGVSPGDTVTVCSDAIGTAYAPINLPANSETTIFLKVTAGILSGAKSFTLTLTPS